MPDDQVIHLPFLSLLERRYLQCTLKTYPDLLFCPAAVMAIDLADYAASLNRTVAIAFKMAIIKSAAFIITQTPYLAMNLLHPWVESVGNAPSSSRVIRRISVAAPPKRQNGGRHLTPGAKNRGDNNPDIREGVGNIVTNKQTSKYH